LKRFYIYGVLWAGGEKVTDFGEIYTEHFSDVYKYVLTLCRNEDIAEEITQETFLRRIGLSHLPALHADQKQYGINHRLSWLCVVQRNTGICDKKFEQFFRYGCKAR
jgi:RNA polymerase sigma-70 factor (ECF subfamily)